MKSFSVIASILLTLCGGINAQEVSKAELSDEFANLFCTDPLRSRIDAFLAKVSERPELRGYIIASPDTSIPGRSAKIVETIRNHIRFRNLDPHRITFVIAAPGDSTHFKFWLVSRGARIPDVKLEAGRTVTRVTTLFDASGIVRVRNGDVEFGEENESGEPCDLGLNLDQFATAVNADRNLTAYLVASAKDRRDVPKVTTALRSTSNKLASFYKLPLHRIRTVYAGQLGESGMQLWLVPKRGKIPKYRRGALDFE